MKFFIILGTFLLSNIVSAAVEYVHDCPSLGDQNQVTLGPGWYVLPGMQNSSVGKTCFQVTTGLTKYLSDDATIITTQSQLEARVTQLEKKIALLLAKKQLNHFKTSDQ